MRDERKYWNSEIETMPLDKLRRLQDDKLQTIVAHAYAKTAFYKKKFDEVGVKPEDIKSVDDLKRLPLIKSAEDFRQAPLADRLAVPWSEVKYMETSSGTTTLPLPIFWTRNEWEGPFMNAEARARWMMGVRPDDVVQVLTGFECCKRGHERVGAMVLSMSAGRGVLDKQIRLAQIAGVTVIEYLPSLVLNYVERAAELGIDIKQTKLRLVTSVGESWAEAFKKRIEREYGISFMQLYGSVEGGIPAAECEAREGMHIFSDCCIVEIIDPDTGKNLGPNEEGEIVITNLWTFASPLIRYRTGDIASLLPDEPCPCGRTLPKMSMVRGRIPMIVKIKGKKILPIDVEEIVAASSELGNEYQIIVDKPGELERLKVKVEYRPEVKGLDSLKKQVEGAINQGLGVESEVELVPMGTIGRTLFKAQRIVNTYEKA